MVQCLIDNKVCPATNKRCKNCSLEDCKRTIEMIETQEEREDKWKRSTLLHELGHCYIITYITHQDKNYNEEDVVDIISNSHDIIRNIADKYFEVKNEHK